MVTLWKKYVKGNWDMDEDQGMPIEATTQQTEGSVDYLNSEQLAPEGTPPAQEIVEPVPSGSAIDAGTDSQINAEESDSDVTVSAEPAPNENSIIDGSAETQTDTKPMEDTMPESSTNTAEDIAIKAAATIQAQTGSFETDFNTAHAAHDDILQQILDLMAERTRLLTILRDSLASVNAHIEEFSTEKVDL